MRALAGLSILLCLSACRSTTTPTPPRELKFESAPVAQPAAAEEEDLLLTLVPVSQDEEPAGQGALTDEEIARRAPRVPDGPPWVLTFAPYIWLLSLDGDGRIGGADVDIDYSFSDILDDLNWVLEGRVTADRGKWSFMGDFTYADLGSDVTVEGLPDGEVETTMGLYLLAAMYEVHRGRFGGDNLTRTHLGAGFLRTIMDTELTFDGGVPAGVRVEEEWLDLVFLGRTYFLLDEKNMIRSEYFLGGFEILGDSSDLAWGLDALYGRRMGKVGNKVLFAGYRYWAIDYDPGNSFALDISVHGPVVGFSWTY